MTTSAQLMRVRVTYDWDTDLTDEGLSYSRETTVWHDVGAADADIERMLAAGCRRAALAYPDFVSRLTLGLIGARSRGGRSPNPNQSPAPQQAPCPQLVVRPLGLRLLEFGPLHQAGPNEFWWPVVGGFLALTSPDRRDDGHLAFRWMNVDGHEVFETELSGFRPAIRGRKLRAPLRSLAYRWTQTQVHTLTMWMFHRWVRRQRSALLRPLGLLDTSRR